MEPIKTFIIRHKETKETFTAKSGKVAWKSIGAAKNAWSVGKGSDVDTEKVFSHQKYGGVNIYRRPKFDEQDKYEVVELKSTDTLLLNKALDLLDTLKGYLEKSNRHTDQATAALIDRFIQDTEQER
jgi:hypothetical protein